MTNTNDGIEINIVVPEDAKIGAVADIAVDAVQIAAVNGLFWGAGIQLLLVIRVSAIQHMNRADDKIKRLTG